MSIECGKCGKIIDALPIHKCATGVSESALSDLLYSVPGHYCIECECLCEMYEQGLSCRCGDPWETEILCEEEYPDKWVKVQVEARRI